MDGGPWAACLAYGTSSRIKPEGVPVRCCLSSVIVGGYEGGGGGICLSGVRCPHVTTVSTKAVFVERMLGHPPLAQPRFSRTARKIAAPSKICELAGSGWVPYFEPVCSELFGPLIA